MNSDTISIEEIQLVQGTWQKVVPKSFEVSQIFYNRLFELYPNFRPMFKTDLKEQGKKLMQMIGTVVLGLSNLGKIEPILQESGIRHVEYGVEKEHYPLLRDVLIWSLREVFKEDFTDDAKVAWEKTYDIMAQMMIDATEEEPSFLLKILRRSKFW